MERISLVGKSNQMVTLQDFINSGLGEIFHKPIKTVGAGRTDAGVHAKMQVFHFDHNWTHGEYSLLQAMRTKFPPESARYL